MVVLIVAVIMVPKILSLGVSCFFIRISSGCGSMLSLVASATSTGQVRATYLLLLLSQ